MLCKPNRFTWHLLGWALLSASLALVGALLKRWALAPGGLRWVVALLPVLPMVGYFLALTKWVRSLDEMQRLIQFEALLIQFAITALSVMGYGVLAETGAVPNPPVGDLWPGIWLLLFVSWSLGQAIVRRRYR
jgi:hypothetical protein